jgi:integrase/recombinase XerC
MSRDLVDEFCRFHHAYNGISHDRARRQRKFLFQFRDRLDHPLEELAGADLRDFLLSEAERGIAPTTTAKNLAMLRPFFSWLRQERVIDGDTWADLCAIKPPRGAGKRVPRPYRRPEIAEFWAELAVAYPWAKDHNGHPASRERGRMLYERYLAGRSQWNSARRYANRVQIEAIIACALYEGMRKREIFDLDLNALHPDNDYIVVAGAAKQRSGETKLRAVPWTADFSREAIGLWLDVRDELAPDHDRPWLRLVNMEANSRKAMYFRKFEMLMHDVGRGWEFHRMRHTCATELLRAGMELHLVSRLLGHASLKETLGYAELLSGDVVKAARRVEGPFGAAVRPK